MDRTLLKTSEHSSTLKIFTFNDANIACNMCEFVPNSKINSHKRFTLKRHMEKTHGIIVEKTTENNITKEKNLCCEFCDFNTAHNYSLSRHHAKVHSGANIESANINV